MDTFNDDHRYWQDRFDTRRVADRIDELLVSERIDDNAKAFIESRDMFFLATCDADGNPQCSYKGGDPGLRARASTSARSRSPCTTATGCSCRSATSARHANVGMLFIDFEHPNRVRVNGVATVDLDDPLRAEMTGAALVVRVRTTQVFPNCSRYIHKMKLVERSKFVPKPARRGADPRLEAHDVGAGLPARRTIPRAAEPLA